MMLAAVSRIRAASMMTSVGIFHVISSIFLTTVTYDTNCKFKGYVSNCTVLVNGMSIRTITVINHCHDPIDITFTLKANNPHLDWRYTFVTSNIAETQTIPDFGKEWHMDLHVALRKTRPNEVLVHADYHTRILDRQGVAQLFLNSTVIINSFVDCDRHSAPIISGPASRIALAMIFVSFLATFVGGLILWIFRRQGDPGDQTLLVDDANVGLAGAIPYQEGAPSERKKSHLPLRVSFTTKQRPPFDTVIENNFVQDIPESMAQSTSPTIKDTLGG